MTDTRKISLCITNYNRKDMLYDCFNNVSYDQRVSEIIIVDDFSSMRMYLDVMAAIDKHNKYSVPHGASRINMFRNERNLGCYRNKREAISKASNEFVIIFDSDNIITTDYIDKVFEQQWSKDTILAPDFAKPHFDYTAFSGVTISKENIKEEMLVKNFTAMINTMNYFVNRDEYLRVWEDRSEPWTADTALQNYNWLKAGNKIHVVKGMQYEHRIEHTEHKSHYQEHNRKTGKLFDDVMTKMKQLK
jgi:glycosyltransferase involved in cell wall biosynthesis